jgi:predicted small lipoprotein YifL
MNAHYRRMRRAACRTPHAHKGMPQNGMLQNSVLQNSVLQNSIPQTVARGYTAPMNRRSPLRLPTLLFVLLSPFALTACGNKGPLVLPEKPTVPSAEAPAEATVESGAPQVEQTTSGQTDPQAETPPPPPALRGR